MGGWSTAGRQGLALRSEVERLLLRWQELDRSDALVPGEETFSQANSRRSTQACERLPPGTRVGRQDRHGGRQRSGRVQPSATMDGA